MDTFAHDDSLPHLPIPPLTSLCVAVPELVAPLAADDTLTNTLAVLDEFVRPGGVGEILHRALVGYQEGLGGNASWLRPLWDDMYLAWRNPLPLEMNYFFRFDTTSLGSDRALPRLVLGLARVAKQLGYGTLEAEESRSGHLSMDQAHSVFYTRIPVAGSDILVPVTLSGPLTIAVVCRGHWFIVPLGGQDGALLTEEQLAGQFLALRRQASSLPEADGVAALTCAPREQATAIRTSLLQNRINRLGLAAIEQALLVLSLDEAHDSDTGLARNLLAGPAANRWFDKSLQIIATENGGLGANMEHAGCDAGIWAYLLTKVESLLSRAQEAGGQDKTDASAEPTSSAPQPRLLEWDIPAGIAAELRTLQTDFFARVDSIELVSREYSEFGREELKGFKTSPDAFLQIAFQVAQYTVFGRLRSSYEAVSMRAFAQGRTECARSSTGSALAFAKALESGEPEGKLRELYRMAESSHLNRLVSCQRGRAVERYLYGLRFIYEQYGRELGIVEMPALFTDPGWAKVKHDALSTSGMGAPCISHFGFGPVVRDGFGVGYAPRKDGSNLVVTSFKDSGLSAESFARAFAKSAERIASLLATKKGDTI